MSIKSPITCKIPSRDTYTYDNSKQSIARDNCFTYVYCTCDKNGLSSSGHNDAYAILKLSHDHKEGRTEMVSACM